MAYGLRQGPETQFPHLYNGDGDSHYSRAGNMVGVVPAHSQVPTEAEDAIITRTTVSISVN